MITFIIGPTLKSRKTYQQFYTNFVVLDLNFTEKQLILQIFATKITNAQILSFKKGP